MDLEVGVEVVPQVIVRVAPAAHTITQPIGGLPLPQRPAHAQLKRDPLDLASSSTTMSH
jgi:hypothetical protein